LYFPDFFGTKFICPTSGRVFIVSYSKDNHVTIKDAESKNVLFDETLGLLDSKLLTLKEKAIYEIDSTGPIFAEFTNLTAPFTTNSSDDISSVFGTYFKLYIPKWFYYINRTNTYENCRSKQEMLLLKKI